jgi:hypothetical protein
MVALSSAREEATLMLALWACAFGVVYVTQHTPGLGSGPDLSIWIIVLIIQSTPYFAALLISMASAFRLPASLLGRDRKLFSHGHISSEESANT